MKSIHAIAFALAALPFAALLHEAQANPAPPPYTLEATTDYAVLPTADPSSLILKVGITGNRQSDFLERPPIHLAIAIDRSGSMTGEKILMARQAALQAFNSLRPDDQVSIIAYSHDVQTILPLTRVDRARNPETYLDQIRANGNTAIYAGVNQAAAELRRGFGDRRAISRIVLLSDGLANTGPSAAPDFIRLGEALARENIAVSTVGLGLDYNEDLMAGLAQGAQGNVYFAENPRDLPRIFESELGDASSLVAQSATIEIDCLPGFRPVQIIGREGAIDGRRVTVEIQQLYAGRQKYVLVECAVAPGDDGQTLEIARVAARVNDLRLARELPLATRAEVAFSSDLNRHRTSVNLDVQRQLVDNKIALAQEQAITLADNGDTKAASQTINELNVWIATNNAVWKDETIATRNLTLASQAETIEKQGVDKRSRKEMRSSSYQSKSQQTYK